MVVALAAWAISAPLLARPSDQEMEAAEVAEERGAAMFAYDQAAWHATDRFRADLQAGGRDLADPALQLRGYVVEPDGAKLLVTFYGEQEGGLAARARYFVQSGERVDGGMLGTAENRALSALALRLIAARDVAIARMSMPDHALCSDSPANTLVLPPDPAGVIHAYVLTSTIDARIYPAGGHYRFDVGANGALVGERGFMKACFPLDIAKARKDKASLLFLTHLLDPQPTEIHAFVSRNVPLPLIVGTVSNRAMWSVANGQVTYLRDIEPDKKTR